MTGAFAILFCMALLSGSLLAGAIALIWRLTPATSQRGVVRWLAVWAAQGLLAPLVVWAFVNAGPFTWLPSFMPQVQAAEAAGLPVFPEWLKVVATGLFVIASYWAAVTLGWVVGALMPNLDPDQRASFRGLVVTCVLALAVPAAIVFLIGGWSLAGLAALFILGPIAGYAPGVVTPARGSPMYARAIARIKFGKYSEAEWEIIRELEKCEDDFEGWMMLAELYATHFRDLRQAEATVLDVCDQPRTTASQLSMALHRLADWHLKLAGDPGAARRSLELITQRLPNTHLARMAQLRIRQVPRTALELREQQASKPIPLPALSDHFHQEPPRVVTEKQRQEAIAVANRCVERLKEDPNDVDSREQLGRAFAETLGKSDAGIEQLELLLGMPDQEAARRAEWLSLIASWHLRYRNDAAAGRRWLERLIEEHPETAQAMAAKRRLFVMRLENMRKAAQETPPPKLKLE